MSRGSVLVVLALIAVGPGAPTQGQTTDIPPIPQRERFVARGDLTLRLRLASDRVQIDELPRVSAIFKNVGTERLLIRKPSQQIIYTNPDVSIYTESGEQLYPAVSTMCRCISEVGRVRELLVLDPQQEYVTELIVPHVTLRGFQDWEHTVQFGGLRPDHYLLRAVYQNAPDSQSPFYDVYESGADKAWEGLIETAPVRFSVVPPSDRRLQELIALIDGKGDADAAIRIVGLARAPQAADALVRRLQRQPPGMAGSTWQSGLLALAALGAIGDSNANSRLLAWIDTLSPQERSQAFLGLWGTDALRPLLRTASGCSGRTLESSYGEVEVRGLIARCPQLADEARAAIQAPYDPARLDSAWNAKGRPIRLLGKLADPVDVPLLLSVARGEQPALERGPRGTPTPSESLINEASAALRQIASGYVERVLGDSNGDSPPDGLSRNVFLAQVRAGIGRLSAERVRVIVPELLAVTPPALTKLAFALRYVDPSAPPSPETPVAATSDPSGNVPKERFDELALVDDVVSSAGEVRQRAFEAITRFGTASSFIPLRNGLVLRPEEAATEIDRTLRNLTFVGYGEWEVADLEAWDTWWRRNRSLTRRQWAEQALIDARPDPTSSATEKAEQALAYLADSSNPPRSILDKATRSRLWQVRIAAATTIARWDKSRAMRLLLRELQNRMLGACHSASDALETLLSVEHEFDCGQPAQRARATDFWRRMIAAQAAP